MRGGENRSWLRKEARREARRRSVVERIESNETKGQRNEVNERKPG